MNKRDDFLKKTKEELAKRCSYRCSNPNCQKITIGAHSRPDKSLCIGRACHISAAAEGGARYNKLMTSQQRRAIENGIWLCADCSDIIDKDEKKYTVEVLKQWKEQAEKELMYSDSCLIKDSQHLLKIIGIAIGAGGTGKSFVTSAISVALSKQFNKKVLCVSVTKYDHALLNLGFERELERLPFSNSSITHNDVKIQTYHSPIYDNVDVIFYDTLKDIHLQQLLKFGKTDLNGMLLDLSKRCGYEYIVCDCGDGLTNSIQTEILLASSEVIIPLGQHSNSNGGMSSVCYWLRNSSSCKNIWVFYSMGYLTSNPKVNAQFRKEFLQTQEIICKAGLNLKEVKTVIPENRYISDCMWRKKDIWKFEKVKNVVQAYKELVNELFG
ncbi:AAA family ATPase [Clostridium minihomine]|uniref:AAA family ATPase n=1 Tax=Clostridium minihomine TaxID=2045012 RepID=UPI0013EC9DF8|nr:AAA family ATPase [Clostridium minihomine]